jgi:hypothetical protein
VNGQTIDLVQRPFQDIVDDILTAIIGGVVREPSLFDVKQTSYPLAHRAEAIRSIVGTHTPPPPNPDVPQHTTFVQGTDYTFDAVRSAVIWQKGGIAPDDETTFYVDYARLGARSPLTDINLGSVTRTITEAIAREIATVYQQINQAYLAGYVDTATGQALDLVVSILDVVRRGADFATGLVTFLRDPKVDGDITIRVGTEMTTVTGSASFVTTDLGTMQRGQVRMDIPVRATDASRGAVGVVPAGAITTLTQQIAGIASITNFDPTVLPAKPETDPELRLRARAALRALGKGTLAALFEAVAEEGSKVDELWDPNVKVGVVPDPTLQGAQKSDPGTVTLLVETEPERYLSLQAKIDEVRAAGVRTTVVARFVFFRPRVVARVAAAQMPADTAGKLKLIAQIIAAMQMLVDQVRAGQSLNGPDFLDKVAKAVKELDGDATNVRVVDAMTWRANIGQPSVGATVDALVTAVAETPAHDIAALRTAFANVVTSLSSGAPPGDRTPDPSLIRSLTGGTPTDAEIEAGKFEVTTTVAGQAWRLVLDMAPADVMLVER